MDGGEGVNDRFVRACRCEPVDRTPVWFMRQAGRYMSEYRAVRERFGFLEMVKVPELAAEITLQPLRVVEVDAAIIFADILPPLEGMGLHVTFERGDGPVVHNPVRRPADVAGLQVPDGEEIAPFTLEAIRLVKRVLAGRLPLIGFSGAPFTLASYAIEGGASRDYRHTKGLMYEQPQVWHDLMGRLTRLVCRYAVAQVAAGADVVQLFDSWAGALAPADYAGYVLPYVRQCVAAVQGAGVPVIYFGTGLSGMLRLLRQTGADVVGIDWRVAIDDAWGQLGTGVAVQGNLDPCVLLGPWSEVERRAVEVLRQVGGRSGHIFNLGHGILPETPVAQVARLAEFVHAFSAR